MGNSAFVRKLRVNKQAQGNEEENNLFLTTKEFEEEEEHRTHWFPRNGPAVM